MKLRRVSGSRVFFCTSGSVCFFQVCRHLCVHLHGDSCCSVLYDRTTRSCFITPADKDSSGVHFKPRLYTDYYHRRKCAGANILTSASYDLTWLHRWGSLLEPSPWVWCGQLTPDLNSHSISVYCFLHRNYIFACQKHAVVSDVQCQSNFS